MLHRLAAGGAPRGGLELGAEAWRGAKGAAIPELAALKLVLGQAKCLGEHRIHGNDRAVQCQHGVQMFGRLEAGAQKCLVLPREVALRGA